MNNTEKTKNVNVSIPTIETITDSEKSDYSGIAKPIGVNAVRAACGIDVSIGLEEVKIVSPYEGVVGWVIDGPIFTDPVLNEIDILQIYSPVIDIVFTLVQKIYCGIMKLRYNVAGEYSGSH